MKSSFQSKLYYVGNGIIVICALIHVFWTVKDYNNILTAVPLWMMVTFVIIFWVLLLVLSNFIYHFILKRFKK